MTLTAGYATTSTDTYTITGTPTPTVIKTSGNAAIAWNDSEKRLVITAGLAAGIYPVVLTASNGTLPNATLNFTLTVNPITPASTYIVYLVPSATSLRVGETLYMDVMLAGNINYTQIMADIAYDNNVLQYNGYENLSGWVAVCAPANPNKVTLRSVPSSSMVLGVPCTPDVRIVTLKFSIKDGFVGTNIPTDISFVSALVSPPAGATGTTTSYGDPVTIIINPESSNGTLRGSVRDAETNAPVAGASVKVYQGAVLITTKSTDSGGSYEIPLPAGYYFVEIEATGYMQFTAYATIEENRVFYMETFLLVTDEEGDGIATGTIRDAVTGNTLAGVNLVARKGWNNADQGDTIGVFSTNGFGFYSITLPYGNYTLIASKDGYITDTINIIVSVTPSVKNSTLSPVEESSNTYRIVLTWGTTPYDLDSHLVANGVHVYYNYPYSTYAWLDIDIVNSYGPETITITDLAALGGFKYCIHDYTNRNRLSGAYELSNSNAIVRVYKGATLLRTYNVPTGRDGTVWNVFSINPNGQITDLNTFEHQSDPALVGRDGGFAALSSIDLCELKDYELFESLTTILCGGF
jgi:hypothetical protein